jgi:hypothetical protein
MLSFIDTPADTIAVTIEGKITGADLDAVMDRLDAAFAAHDKVNVFVETRDLDGIELSGLGRYTARALPLFGKLTRFGHVAVVSDQAWLRAATRLESAVLPFISYRVFEPAERDQALAWVKGGST